MLLDMLGGVCTECGSDEKLEFNHLYQHEHNLAKLSIDQRMMLYYRESKLGLIDLRCKRCNKRYVPLPLPHDAADVGVFYLPPSDPNEPF